jgi:magnesium-transporting ATPase (P-type)
MLEAAIVLLIALGGYPEAAIIAGLLVFNAVLGLFQEGRAQATLAALKSRLALNASIRRDGRWATLPTAALVPGVVAKLSLGGVVAADVRLTGGEILLDQSMLTGESVPQCAPRNAARSAQIPAADGRAPSDRRPMVRVHESPSVGCGNWRASRAAQPPSGEKPQAHSDGGRRSTSRPRPRDHRWGTP